MYDVKVINVYYTNPGIIAKIPHSTTVVKNITNIRNNNNQYRLISYYRSGLFI